MGLFHLQDQILANFLAASIEGIISSRSPTGLMIFVEYAIAVMSRKYAIRNQDEFYFVTFTVVDWIDVSLPLIIESIIASNCTNDFPILVLFLNECVGAKYL